MKKIFLILSLLLTISCEKQPNENPNEAGNRIVEYLNNKEYGKIYENFTEENIKNINVLIDNLKLNIKTDNQSDMEILNELKVSKDNISNMDNKDVYVALMNGMNSSFLTLISSIKSDNATATANYKFIDVVEDTKSKSYIVNYDLNIIVDNDTKTKHSRFYIVNEKGHWKITDLNLN